VIEVRLLTHFRGYTGGEISVMATGETIGGLLTDLDRQFTGLRFRIIDEQDEIRRHIKLFRNRDQVDSISAALADGDVVHIIGALSGG